jgi:hypothetical protein
MNRIYQGRAINCELYSESSSSWEALPNWEQVVWDHHELFQDAVNYYVMALLALATDSTNPISPIKKRLAETDSSGEPTTQQVWLPFRRKGATRQGMRDSVGKYICPTKKEPTPDDCYKEILSGNSTNSKILDEALTQLLEACKGGGGKIRNASPEFHPLFCDSDTTANFKNDPLMLKRNWDQEALPFVLHNPAITFKSSELDKFNVHSIATPNNREPILGRVKAVKLLGKALKLLVKEKLIDKSKENHYHKLIDAKPDDFELLNYGGSSAKGAVKIRLYALLIFQHVEKSNETFEAFKQSFPAPKPSAAPPKPKDFSKLPDDPVNVSRGSRGYVFKSFTALDCWKTDGTSKASWKKFDFAAFEEALKALHQVDEKKKEREAEADKLTHRKKCMLNEETWKSSGESEEAAPFVLQGDPRIERLEELLGTDLAEEYEIAEGQSIAYGLHPRTIRGFWDLKRKWNKICPAGIDFSKKDQEALIAILRDHQKQNSETMGSARIFDALIEEKNWLIWQEPASADIESWRKKAKLKKNATFADNPLQALTDFRLLERDIERFKEPISFTPADPVCSRRLFYFSDAESFSRGGKFGHQPNETAVVVPLAIKELAQFSKQRVKLSYSAPRLLRDQLRTDAGEDLTAAPFSQPMMVALGVPSVLKQDIHKYPVSLMPSVQDSGKKRILLNFPIDLDTDPLIKKLGLSQRWTKQFAAFDNKNFYLYWPSLIKKLKSVPNKWWWDALDDFQCMAVDLGQRDAGAFAVLDVKANHSFGPKPSRLIGSNGSGKGAKKWAAAVSEMGMIKLPGEDAMIMQLGKLVPEPYGEKGRLATEQEWKDACVFCEKLGMNPSDIVGDDKSTFSFPELNDRLLFVFRRARTNLAKLQSYSWRLKDKEKAAAADKEIRESPELSLALQAAKAKTPDLLAANAIKTAEDLRSLMPELLTELANRILPQRTKIWEWVAHHSSKNSFMLRRTLPGISPIKRKLMGQRGLSIRRIEQLENLRINAQSLNRALMQTPGLKPVLGKTTRGIELPDPCPEILEKLDRLKEQRVNQTAHMILARALGLKLKSPSNPKVDRKQKDIHGEYEKFRAPVDFIVIEDLSRYLSSQGRSKSENSRLMKWSHRAIRDKLIELCEPYGMSVVESTAAYSSRFCSRTGTPGFRVEEVSPVHASKWPWKKDLEDYKKITKGELSPSRDRKNRIFKVHQLFEILGDINKERKGKTPRTLLVPRPGGPVFIPASGKSMQADINAAINLALRAVASPDAHDIHHRIRTAKTDSGFVSRTDTKRENARFEKNRAITFRSEKDQESLSKDRNPNFFIDQASVAEFDQASLEGESIAISSGRGIWGTLRKNEWYIVNKLNNDRLQDKWGLTRLLDESPTTSADSKPLAADEEDQIPM